MFWNYLFISEFMFKNSCLQMKNNVRFSMFWNYLFISELMFKNSCLQMKNNVRLSIFWNNLFKSELMFKNGCLQMKNNVRFNMFWNNLFKSKLMVKNDCLQMKNNAKYDLYWPGSTSFDKIHPKYISSWKVFDLINCARKIWAIKRKWYLLSIFLVFLQLFQFSIFYTLLVSSTL